MRNIVPLQLFILILSTPPYKVIVIILYSRYAWTWVKVMRDMFCSSIGHLVQGSLIWCIYCCRNLAQYWSQVPGIYIGTHFAHRFHLKLSLILHVWFHVAAYPVLPRSLLHLEFWNVRGNIFPLCWVIVMCFDFVCKLTVYIEIHASTECWLYVENRKKANIYCFEYA